MHHINDQCRVSTGSIIADRRRNRDWLPFDLGIEAQGIILAIVGDVQDERAIRALKFHVNKVIFGLTVFGPGCLKDSVRTIGKTDKAYRAIINIKWWFNELTRT